MRGHLRKLSNAFVVKCKVGPARFMVRSPRTLNYCENPQILDKGMEDRLEQGTTLWGAPMDLERQRSPWRRSQSVEIWERSSVRD